MNDSTHLIRTQVSFEAAHRLYAKTYSEDCTSNIHGHSYKVTVVLGSEELNDAGMVADFKQIKEILRDSIEVKYDHSCILHALDPLATPIAKNCKKVHIVTENPTAEWMAQRFFYEISCALKLAGLFDVYVHQIAVQETENNIAIYSGQ